MVDLTKFVPQRIAEEHVKSKLNRINLSLKNALHHLQEAYAELEDFTSDSKVAADTNDELDTILRTLETFAEGLNGEIESVKDGVWFDLTREDDAKDLKQPSNNKEENNVS